MKATGLTRKVDELGRVVLPIESRRLLNINEGDSMEIFIHDNQIILRKYQPTCIICKNFENLIEIGNIKLCPNCIRERLKSQNRPKMIK